MTIRLNGESKTDGAGEQKVVAGGRRSNIEVIADMLRAGENGAGKTEIMYTANMSYSQIQKYLNYLVKQGFVNKVKMGNATIAYQVTDSGFKLLKAIDTLMGMLKASNNQDQQ
jgi:predicted transcriptional regulator